MLPSTLLALAATLSTASAAYKGFNYGTNNVDGSLKQEADYTNEFTTAANLVGTSGFTSARLYTMIQTGTEPISAIPAAIKTGTTLLLGLWGSAGQAQFNNELAALDAAITQYGTPFTSLIAGISVGSEDLYRISPTGIQNMAGIGAAPSDIVNYIAQTRTVLSNHGVSAPVGHVDTWTAWVNGSNNAVTSVCDFIGMDAYPYYQPQNDNSIANGNVTFWNAYDATVAAVGGKPVWITETGWPVTGPTDGAAVASIPNAQTYWDEVGCAAFGQISTWWYTLQDAYPTTSSPSFGVVGGSLTTTPLYSLTC